MVDLQVGQFLALERRRWSGAVDAALCRLAGEAALGHLPANRLLQLDFRVFHLPNTLCVQYVWFSLGSTRGWRGFLSLVAQLPPAMGFAFRLDRVVGVARLALGHAVLGGWWVSRVGSGWMGLP